MSNSFKNMNLLLEIMNISPKKMNLLLEIINISLKNMSLLLEIMNINFLLEIMNIALEIFNKILKISQNFLYSKINFKQIQQFEKLDIVNNYLNVMVSYNSIYGTNQNTVKRVIKVIIINVVDVEKGRHKSINNKCS